MPISDSTRKSRSGATLAQRMALAENRPCGFDYMRIFLAIIIIVWHSFELTIAKAEFRETLGYRVAAPLFYLAVPMFFALSGFLVAGSLARCRSLVTFLGLRVFRIVPALAVEVTLSALLLGSLLSSLPLSEYLTHPEFYRYFLNIVGEIHYHLPGVFEKNLDTRVNLQLWTIPYELICYVLLAAAGMIGAARNRNKMLVLLVVLYAVQVAGSFRDSVPPFMAGPPASSLVLAFVAGITAYQYKDRIPMTGTLFVLALAITLAMNNMPYGSRFSAIPLSYVTLYLGTLNPRRNQLLLGGDYSYGLYLYGVPIQQALIATHPFFQHWVTNSVTALFLAGVTAVLSWRFVEKPALQKKNVLKSAEDWYMNLAFVKKVPLPGLAGVL